MLSLPHLTFPFIATHAPSYQIGWVCCTVLATVQVLVGMCLVLWWLQCRQPVDLCLQHDGQASEGLFVQVAQCVPRLLTCWLDPQVATWGAQVVECATPLVLGVLFSRMSETLQEHW